MLLLLYALMATIEPAQALSDLRCVNVSFNSPTDPASDTAAQATFRHPAFDRRHGNGYYSVTLGGVLSDPLSVWRLVEINPSPGAKESPGYVILQNDKTGALAPIAVEEWNGGAPQQPKKFKLRPSTRPTPAWPGIGCVYVEFNPLKNGDKRYYAALVAGEYVAEDDLGWFHDGQLLPKPWDNWRVAKVFSGAHFHGPGPMEDGVMLHNENTGQDVEILLKRVGLMLRATTHPSDDLIAAAATQPAK